MRYWLPLLLAIATTVHAQDSPPSYALLPDEAVAQQAVELIQEGSALRLFCDPCGDRYVQEVRVTSVSIEEHPEERNYRWVLHINGAPLPIDEIYLRREGQWRSLAHLLGLDPEGVPETIYPFLRAEPIPSRE